MDGGRRNLRPVREASHALAPSGLSQAAFGLWSSLGAGFAQTVTRGLAHAATAPHAPAPVLARHSKPVPGGRVALQARARKRAARRQDLARKALAFLQAPGVGWAFSIVLLAATVTSGMVMGGQYQTVVATYGDMRDVVARGLGFGIKAVTITGQKELGETEILAAAGLSPRNSLLFADVDAIRAGLLRTPLVKDAIVRKLYPDQMVIAITEREPFAVWQRDGNVQVVASDGTPIDSYRDNRFHDLPFVVGEGANQHIAEYLSLLDAAGDLRAQIRAGIWVGNRRWDIKLVSGLEIRLPEIAADEALRNFAKLARDNRLLDKDMIGVDLRIPGRLVARLSEEAATARADALAHKKGKGGV